MANSKKRLPNKGDRVAALGQHGTFVVSQVDSTIQTVELKMIGRDFALSTIPWRALTFLDELDASQAAARIVRDATKDQPPACSSSG
jgi:hypothetical protein